MTDRAILEDKIEMYEGLKAMNDKGTRAYMKAARVLSHLYQELEDLDAEESELELRYELDDILGAYL